MGSYVFIWPYPADDVHITGNFDDWGKSIQMDKVGKHWEKEVHFPSADEKVLYKFIVDGEWIVDQNAPKEGDGHYNTNNVLLPHQITRRSAAVPTTGDLPGAFPETPAGETPSFSVNPIPATSGSDNPINLPAGVPIPNQKNFTSNTIGSTVTTSKEDYEKAGSGPMPSREANEFSVNPIPASSGIDNPISVAPGTKLPPQRDITSNTLGSTVTTSKEDYEKSGSSATVPEPKSVEEPTFSVKPIGGAVTTSKEDYEKATGPSVEEPTFGVKPIGGAITTSKEDYEKATGPSVEEPTFSVNPIPASKGIDNPISVPAGAKLPAQTGTIDSAVTTSKEDYENAGTSAAAPPKPADEPTFSVNPIPASSGIDNPISLAPGAKIPDQKSITPHTVDSTVTTSKEDYEKSGSSAFPAAAGVAGAAAGGAALAGAFIMPKDKNVVPESGLPYGPGNTIQPNPFISSSGPGTTTAELASKVPLENDPTIRSSGPGTTTEELASKVPLESDPFKKPGTDATTSQLASDAEVPLKSSPFISSSGPGTTTAALAANVPIESKEVPEIVKESISKAHEDPEAAASPEVVKEKADLEKELLSKTKPSEAAGESARAAAEQTSYYGLATSVPSAVEKSMQKAHAPPEAATETSAVAEKSAMEQELLSKIPSTDEAGEPAPTIAAATSTTAPASTSVAAAATSVTDGKTANETVPDTDTSSAARGPSVGEIAGGAAVGGAAAVGAATLAARHKDADAEPPRVADSQKPDITTEASPATATTSSVPGQSKAAAAAVSDGTNGTPSATVPKTTVPLETSEAATTEYAPIRTSALAPGVSSGAAAALSDGTEDPTLAEEPAVKLMQQNEGGVASSSTNTAPAHDATTTGATTAAAAATGTAVSTGLVHDATTTGTLTTTTAPTTGALGTKAPSAALEPTGVPTLTSAGTVPAEGDVKKETISPTAGAAEPKTPTTPAKKTTQSAAAQSPAASTATSNATEKKKKKRHRISAFFHKIFD